MTTPDQLVAAYLDDLATAAQDLPVEQRDELLGEVREHIAAARASLAPDDTSGIRDILNRLGTPREILREAAPPAAGATPGSPARDRWTVALLTLSGYIVPLGFIALFLVTGYWLDALAASVWLGALAVWVTGLVRFWGASRWNLMEKLLGTLAWPAAMLPGLVYVFTPGPQTCRPSPHGEMCTSSAPLLEDPFLVGVLVMLTVPLIVGAYLLRRTRRATGVDRVPTSALMSW